MYINYRTELEIMRRNFRERGKRPIKPIRPLWVRSDILNSVYTEMKILWEHGEVYWGTLVQANNIMFGYFPYSDCPGNVLFTTNEYINNNPEVIRQIGSEIFSYKNTYMAPRYLKRVVDVVTGERERLFNYPIPLNETGRFNDCPQILWNENRLFFTTMMFFRKYMPKRKLCSGIFPIVAAPHMTHISIMLPEKYWSDGALELFIGK